MKHLLIVIFLLFGIAPLYHTGNGQSQKYVVLKLDDVIAGSDGQIISDRWQRVSDYLEAKKIKAAFGIIGFSLEEDNPAYFRWITERAGRGFVEFWNHGFRRRTQSDSIGEFEHGYGEQLYSLQMTNNLAKAKLGLALATWGPHWSGVNADTDRALSQIPEIKITFGFPDDPVHFKGVVIPRKINLEYPTHNPDFEAFKSAYLNREGDLDCFYLQGHPMSWDDTRWENFVKIVEFLESEKVNFVTPAELLDIMAGKRE